jgi:hypothetical protein
VVRTFALMAAIIGGGCGRIAFDAEGVGTADDNAGDDGDDGSGSDTPDTLRPRFVQGNRVQETGNPGSLGVSFFQDVVAGDLLVIEVNTAPQARTITAVTDSRGNGYTLTTPQFVSGSLDSRAMFAYTIAQSSGPVTVTATTDAPNNRLEIRAAEYANIDPDDPYDTVQYGAGPFEAPDNSATSGPFTTDRHNELAVSIFLCLSPCVSEGIGQISRDTAFGDILSDFIAGEPGSYQAHGTSDGAWLLGAAVFYAKPI